MASYRRMTAAGTRLTIMLIQLAGVLLSGFLVLVTYTAPGQVEDRYQQIAFATVERAAEQKLEAAEEKPGVADRLRAFGRSIADGAADLNAQRERYARAILANALSERCGDGCSAWVREARMADNVLVERAAALRLGETTLEDFIVGRYDRAVGGMIADLRRFGLVNVVVLSLALALLASRPTMDTRVAVFSVAVTAYTAWATYDYLFQQDWKRAVMLRDWAATGYQATMIVVAFILFDWVVLKGRITNAILDMLGSVSGP